MVTADQLICHAVGDYILQSDWMANEKTKKSIAALAHVATYFLPFLFLTHSWKALAVIIVTHFIIDRFRLARYVCWAKNFLSPPTSTIPVTDHTETRKWWLPWKQCNGTGYPNDKTQWMTVWLMIITDNLMHVLCNALALRYL